MKQEPLDASLLEYPTRERWRARLGEYPVDTEEVEGGPADSAERIRFLQRLYVGIEEEKSEADKQAISPLQDMYVLQSLCSPGPHIHLQPRLLERISLRRH